MMQSTVSFPNSGKKWLIPSRVFANGKVKRHLFQVEHYSKCNDFHQMVLSDFCDISSLTKTQPHPRGTMEYAPRWIREITAESRAIKWGNVWSECVHRSWHSVLETLKSPSSRCTRRSIIWVLTMTPINAMWVLTMTPITTTPITMTPITMTPITMISITMIPITVHYSKL